MVKLFLWPLPESNRHTVKVQNFEFCAFTYFAKGPLFIFPRKCIRLRVAIRAKDL